MDYVIIKWLHVISSTILFGAGVGSAFHLFASTLRRGTQGAAASTRNVVLADWLFTLPSAIFQLASGLWLVHKLKLPLSTPWIAVSLALYAIAIGCWLPVLWLQLRMRDHAVAAAERGAELPRAYWALFAWWVGLGFAGFFAFIGIFWLMVAKSVPFA
jgi:uncharacterized membrane protein